MIECIDGVFHLSTGEFSYLFRILPTGQPEQLHFGSPVTMADARALCCKTGTGWGSCVAYDKEGLCLDTLRLEWSGSGRGDYRETPVELETAQGPIPTDFVFDSYEIFEDIAPMTSGLPQAKAGLQTLCLTLKDTRGLKLKLYYTLFEEGVTRRCVLENGSAQPVTVRKLMSFCLDLPGKLEMTTFDGGWIAEMRPNRAPVGPGRITHESVTGFSSNRHQPGFLLSEAGAGEDHGTVYGVNLVWSGNHYASAQRSLQGLNRILQGISPDHFGKTLACGECFETPEAVLVWSGEGFNGLSRRFHSFVNRRIVPKQWQFQERPVLYNSWEGCYFDFNRARLLDLAGRAKKLGCELFVLDDGWFGKRNDDTAGLGDYAVNKKKLPGGIKALADRINGMGMEFGLWFEPEAVNPDSDLYRAHPDWALTDDLTPVLGRNELLLDLTKSEVRDYIVENVGATLDSANITYVKWDMNRHSVALGNKAYDYVLGLYEVLDRIFTPRPQVLLESCSSGGNRFDLGMLCYSPQVWCSDDTDPIERLTIQGSLSYLYPQSTFGAHVSAAPHAQTLRNTPLTTRGNVSFFGLLGYELDLKHLLPIEEKEIANQIAFYKRYRQIFQFGTFTRLPGDDAIGWQVSGGNTHIAGLFHDRIPAAPGYERLRLRRLDGEKRYALLSREQLLRVGMFGGLVKHIVPVELDPNGIVLRTADRHYPMADGQEAMEASGNALMAGVMLSPKFQGTGYNKDGRNQGDYCSNVYVVEKI